MKGLDQNSPDRPTGDMTGSWRRRKYKIVKIGETPPINKDGFWQQKDFNDVKKQYHKKMRILNR